MNPPCDDVESVLTFPCPRCGDAQRDEFEVLDFNVPTDWRCASCGRVFSVQLIDCSHCAAESVFVALTASEHPSYRELTCCHCGKRRHCDEDIEGEED